ncbi:MAG TPA: thiamine pyrophosphate-binding protein [Pyrinomonadaceae bacterium]|nr:thiamine pyrophosphate-binding protein [Pyrinomonadaceae bacterium]
MRELVMGYLRNDLSRRGFLRQMAAAGFSATAAKEVLQSLSPITSAATSKPYNNPVTDAKTIQGTGGEILVEQWSAAGVEFIVIGNSSHLRNIYDALVDRPGMHPILAVEEGQAVAIASGYTMASGKLGVVAVSVAGAPHASSNMYNAMMAQLPLMVTTDMVPAEFEDREGIYEGRNLIGAADSTSKWKWYVGQSDLIPDVTRRAIKVATTAPGGPVLITYPEDVLARNNVKATIIPQEKFNVPTAVKASPEAINMAAQMLLEAKSPAMYIGPEGWTSGARRACVELAELLGIPAMRVLIDSWVDCFPTSHPLFINAEYTPNVRFPRGVDVLLVVGGYMPNPGAAKTIHITTAGKEIGKAHPEDLPILADARYALQDIIDAIKSRATKERLAGIAKPRIDAIRAFNQSMHESLAAVAKADWENNPISWPRLAMELDKALDKDALIVDELSTEKTKVFSYLRTSDGGRTRIGRSIQQALGWGIGLSIGTKMAKPNQQVVSVIGDGAFLFGQCEALWSMARYEVPVITVVFNNRSYNEPRQRIMGKMGKQGQMGKDMACYLGSPDVDFAKVASGFGIAGETVTNPAQIGPALDRAIKTTRDGKPYLLDVVVERSGIGAESTWYPAYSVARQRERRV